MTPDPGIMLQHAFCHAELSKVIAGRPQCFESCPQSRSLTILSISSSTGHQVPLAALDHRNQHHLVRCGHSYGVLAADDDRSTGSITYSSLLSSINQATSARAGTSRPSNIHSRRLSLAGSSPSDRPPMTVLVSTPPSTNGMGTAAWQLQLQRHVPLCKGLQDLPGHVVACCLLTRHATLQPDSQQQLWQLADAACTSKAGAAAPDHVIKEATHSSSTSGAELLQVLAAAGAAVAAIPANCSCSHSADAGASCCVSCSPVQCCEALYSAFAHVLQPPASTASDRTVSSHVTQYRSPTPPPLCMYLAGTCSGQVWLCTPDYALHGSSTNSAQTAQTHCRLLLDLHQPIVAILHIPPTRDTSNSSSSAAAVQSAAAAPAPAAGCVVVVGCHGRIACLQLQPGHMHDSTAGTGSRQAGQCKAGTTEQAGLPQSLSRTCRLRMVQQQLPIAVVSAELLVESGTQQQQKHKQQQLLLLLSSCGNLHVAELALPNVQCGTAEGCQTDAAAADAAAAEPAGTAAPAVAAGTPGTAAAQGSGQLQLRTVKLPVPRASCVWVLPPSLQPAAVAAAAGFGNVPAVRQDEAMNCTAVIVQLHDSHELISLQAGQVADYVRQQSNLTAAAGSSRGTTSFGSQPAMAAAAAAARQQLTGLISAIEVLADARRLLEQTIISQDKYLVAVGQDMAAFSGPRSITTVPAAAAAAAAAATTVAAAVPPTHQSKLRCSVELTGVWPAPAAVSGSSVCNSLHLAVTMHITCGPTGSNSSYFTSSCSAASNSAPAGSLGPGWQLLVSFVPEAAGTRSWQSTVPASSSSSDSAALHAALLLPVPTGCALLQEGGWLRVYAVKQPPGRLGREYSEGASIPVVALLAEKHVTTLQLSQMLTANPAADAVSKVLGASTAGLFQAVTATQQVYGSTAKSAAVANSSSSSYSCTLRFEAGSRVTAALDSTAGQAALHAPLQQLVAMPVKRLRQEDGWNMAAVHEQQQQSEHAVGVPLGTSLGAWLASVGHLPQQPDMHSNSSSSNSGFGAFAAVMLQSGRPVAGFEPQNVLTLPGQPAMALLHGQVLFRLAGSCMGQMSWAARPRLSSSGQLKQQSSAAAATGSSGAHGIQVGDSNAEAMPVQVVLQASSIPALAQLHRAVMLAAVQQFECKQYAGNGGGRSSSNSSSSSGNSKHGRWQIILLQAEQLRMGLQQLTKLQQQLFCLQDKADDFMVVRNCVVQQIEAFAVSHSAGDAVGTAASNCSNFTELLGCWGQWRTVLDGVYGRMLLALADVAYLKCQEV